ncbi:MAG: hypothetical protein M3179_00475 [Actinomycetota bacterium]|nr:hypothetical protein [Actinomycetota bacterium]
MELSVGQSVAGAFGVTLVLAALHLAAPHIRRLPVVPERATGSFAGGVAVAYVFLHLLPELAAGNEAVGELLDDVVTVTPVLDLAIFAVALAGFTAFYGLERLSRRSGSAATDEPRAGVFRLHLGSFLVYNGLITYTMPLRLRAGLVFGLLFAAAMALHFVLTDRTLEEYYRKRFDTRGRFLLAGGLVGGWLLAWLFAPSSTVVVSLLTALLGGSILLNVFKEELPGDRRSSFGWFLVGLVLYAALLTVTTAAEA